LRTTEGDTNEIQHLSEEASRDGDDWFARRFASLHSARAGNEEPLNLALFSKVVPFAHDQHDNAARVERLGVARTIARDSYKAERVASELKELLGSPAYMRNAREIGSRVRSESGAALAADLIIDQLNERRSDRFRLRTVA
jgi:hypothetical protein